MVLQIYFSQLDQTAFLQQRGWHIYRRPVVRTESIHGSHFLDTEELRWFAHKEDQDIELRYAFEKELKHKLIFE